MIEVILKLKGQKPTTHYLFTAADKQNLKESIAEDSFEHATFIYESKDDLTTIKGEDPKIPERVEEVSEYARCRSILRSLGV